MSLGQGLKQVLLLGVDLVLNNRMKQAVMDPYGTNTVQYLVDVTPTLFCFVL